jgi:hypothetical protein
MRLFLATPPRTFSWEVLLTLHQPYMSSNCISDHCFVSPGCKEFEDSYVELSPRTVVPISDVNPNTYLSINIDMEHDSRTVNPADQQWSEFSQGASHQIDNDGSCCDGAETHHQTVGGICNMYADARRRREWKAERRVSYRPERSQAVDHRSAAAAQHPLEQDSQPSANRQSHAQDLSQPPEKPCDHWQTRNCAMTGDPKRCCSCSDTRPNAPSYSRYVDGLGWTMGAERWTYYCPGCQSEWLPPFDLCKTLKPPCVPHTNAT